MIPPRRLVKLIAQLSILRSYFRLIIAIPLLLSALPAQQHISAQPTYKNTVAPFFVLPKPPQFPDFTANYQKMVDERAAEATQQALAAQAVVYTPPVYTPPQNGYKLFIYDMESGNNPHAINKYSGACGLGQSLPCSKMPCSLDDYSCQDSYFTAYALNRYGSWEAAYSFWVANRWW